MKKHLPLRQPASYLIFTFFFLSLFSIEGVAQKSPEITASQKILILTLTNGDRVSGTVVAINPDRLEIETIYAGRFTILTNQVVGWQIPDETLRQNLAKYFFVKDLDTIAREMHENKEPPQIVNARETSNQSVAKKLAPAASKAARADAWKRQVNFAYTMTRGNNRSSDVNVSLNISRKQGTKKIGFSSFGRYGVNNGTASANLFTSTLRYERTAFKIPIFTESQYEIDRMKKLDLRFSENLGLSYPVLKGDTRQLSFDFGTGFTKENYETGVQKLNATSLMRLSAMQKLSQKTVLSQQATFFSDLADPSSYRIQAEASVTTPLTKNLALRLSGINRYDARPQGQAKPNDFTLLTGFTFNF